jgi:tRNA nucleotidyltransferase (CCA-adding enzyme)
MPKPDVSNLKAAYECLDSLRQNKTPGSIYDVLVRSNEAAYFSWVLAALSPWGNIKESSYDKKGKPGPPFATIAGREGIKAANKVCDVITASYNHRDAIVALKNAVTQKEPFIHERDRFGMAIRQWEGRGDHWRLQVLYAILVEALQAPDSNFIADWQLFLDHLQELDVMDAPSLKRLVDGGKLAEGLGVKPGKWMTQAMDIGVAWQLRNPEATDPAAAIAEVRSKRKELGIPMQ